MNKGFDEGKYTLDGLEMPFHCLMMEISQHSSEDTSIPHYHDYIELLYGIDADIDVYINGALYEFKSGDLVIINAKESHSLHFKSSNAYYAVIKVLPEILYNGVQSMSEMKYLLPFITVNSKHERVIKTNTFADDFIHKKITNIMSEWNGKDYGYELSIRADILQIFLCVLRYWQNNNIEAVNKFEYSDDMIRLIQSVTEYTYQNCASVTAKSAAEYCNLSYSYFSRSFKQIMNQSFTEYLNYIRISKAERLLSTTQKSISDISDEVGFSTTSYFIELFKKHKQKTPKQYRMNLINK